jgi:hypothetical protein
MNQLRSTSTGLASSTLPLALILVRCDQLVRAPHSHATTVHGDCKIAVQFSHGFFPLNPVIAKTRKVRSRITRVACTVLVILCFSWLCSPVRAFAFSCARILDHTQRRGTVVRTALEECSARRRDLYLTTHNKHPCPWCDSNPRSQ